MDVYLRYIHGLHCDYFLLLILCFCVCVCAISVKCMWVILKFIVTFVFVLKNVMYNIWHLNNDCNWSIIGVSRATLRRQRPLLDSHRVKMVEGSTIYCNFCKISSVTLYLGEMTVAKLLFGTYIINKLKWSKKC